ncbi:hypothetical protein PM082_008952 [Marasmius tenuissimus]|nr:hypothetical protein PM082_008952 [Marasmius tenuissimus]
MESPSVRYRNRWPLVPGEGRMNDSNRSKLSNLVSQVGILRLEEGCWTTTFRTLEVHGSCSRASERLCRARVQNRSIWTQPPASSLSSRLRPRPETGLHHFKAVFGLKYEGKQVKSRLFFVLESLLLVSCVRAHCRSSQCFFHGRL